MVSAILPPQRSKGDRPGWSRLRLLPALVVGVVFVAFVALHGLGLYLISERLLLAWGVLPFPFPFLDADTVMSALRCLREGVDVFETNPCDALGRLYDYSPVWLHAAVLPFTVEWIVPVGLGIDLIFIASLLLLPAGRNRWCVAALVAGVLSTAVAYAVERANNDLVIFVLVLLAATLSTRRWPICLLGYALAFTAGILKYYPMLTMILAVRERPGRFVAVTVAALAALAAVVALEYGSLVRALRLIPSGALYGDLFGARTLPRGLLYLTRFPHAWADFGEVALTAGSVLIGLALVVWGRIGEEIGRLTPRERACLLTGAALIVGCFFTAQNIGYRAIHLLLVLPGLSALAVLASRRHLWAITTVLAVILLWSEGLRHWTDAAVAGLPPWTNLEWQWHVPNRVQFVAWELREVCWWWVVTVLWGAAFAIIGLSETGGAALAWLAARLRVRRSNPA